MHLRALAGTILAAMLALGGCSSVDQTTCAKAAAAGTWDVTFDLKSGPSQCPKLDRSLTLPGGCEATCNCIDSAIGWVAASGAQQDGTCALRFAQECPGLSSLNCDDTVVDSETHASGSCSYHGLTDGGFDCVYGATWSKQ